MNLAVRDVRHNLGRFVLTTVGVGLLLMIVMGMGGIYRGLVQDATLLVDRVGADLWVVQRNTRGPFAEESRVPYVLEDRLRAVPGVAQSRSFLTFTIQREHRGRPLRLTVQGLAWPADRGAWLPMVAGRPLGQAHYEMIADESLKLPLGTRVAIARDVYTVVGLTRAMTSPAGDAMAFFTRLDAQAIVTDSPGEAMRLGRNGRYARTVRTDLGRKLPAAANRSRGPAAALPELARPDVSAVMVTLAAGADGAKVRDVIAGWPDVSVLTTAQERELLLGGIVDRSRRQLALFRVLLIIVSAIIMALILYTLTLDKLHDIALLKLIGARNRVILGLILQQALLLGVLGYGVAFVVGRWAFPLFPRRVIVTVPDLWLLGGIVVTISVLASLIGIAKALRVAPHEVLA
ncbi:MAG TPA: ABC transporter permease [Polyangia bacterium]|jgi:putative ABC transport system permease protein